MAPGVSQPQPPWIFFWVTLPQIKGLFLLISLGLFPGKACLFQGRWGCAFQGMNLSDPLCTHTAPHTSLLLLPLIWDCLQLVKFFQIDKAFLISYCSLPQEQWKSVRTRASWKIQATETHTVASICNCHKYPLCDGPLLCPLWSPSTKSFGRVPWSSPTPQEEKLVRTTLFPLHSATPRVKKYF